MEAGHPGRHGDSAAQPVGQVSSCVSVLVTTHHPDTVAVCVWDRAGTKGDDNRVRLTVSHQRKTKVNQESAAGTWEVSKKQKKLSAFLNKTLFATVGG